MTRPVENAQSVVMIQCVGCRNEDRNYCSRVCCSHAIKNALKLKAKNPDMDIDILFRDVRTYGLREDYYREASDKGVRFIRWDPSDPPQVETGTSEDGRDVIKVTVADPIMGVRMELDADILSLAAAVIPARTTEEIAGLFKVTLSPDGFYKEAHVKLKPVEFATDGRIPLRHGALSQAHPGVDQPGLRRCRPGPDPAFQGYRGGSRARSARSMTMTACPAGPASRPAPTMRSRSARRPLGRKAWVNPVLCKGDGVCNAKCPTNAIVLKHFTNDAMCSQIDAAVTDADILKQIDAAAV